MIEMAIIIGLTLIITFAVSFMIYKKNNFIGGIAVLLLGFTLMSLTTITLNETKVTTDLNTGLIDSNTQVMTTIQLINADTTINPLAFLVIMIGIMMLIYASFKYVKRRI